MKRRVVERFEHVSKLGRYVFENVVVWVDDDLRDADVEPTNTDYGLDGEEIRRLDREIAQGWLKRWELEKRKDLTPEELSGIQLVLDVNASELAELLGLDKSTISKIYKGEQPIQKPWVLAAVLRLKEHLDAPDLRSLRSIQFEDSPVPAVDVADELLRLSRPEEGETISNLKINKLLYYVQAWALALFDRPIFSDQIVAYEHGPVVISVYRKFKGLREIPVPAEPAENPISEPQQRLVRAVYKHYGKFSAWQLRDMTHAEGPWVRAEQSRRIDRTSIRDHFRRELR